MMILAIAIGGALGAVARFAGVSTIGMVLGPAFPYGTLIVNIVGSFLAGLCLMILGERFIVQPELRGLLMIGFLGGFTTFSAFSIESVSLLMEGQLWKATLNTIASVTLCLIAAWLGILLGRSV